MGRGGATPEPACGASSRNTKPTLGRAGPPRGQPGSKGSAPPKPRAAGLRRALEEGGVTGSVGGRKEQAAHALSTWRALPSLSQAQRTD